MVNDFFEKEYTYSEIIENLKNNDADDFVKIFSVINLENIKNTDDFKLLLYHLTNHSTPIREAVALKLEEISKNSTDLFLNDYSKTQLLGGIIDINPNISRAICSILENNREIQDLIFDDLIEKTKKLIASIKEDLDFKININKKSHAKNKKNFALYWYLEALSFCENIKNNSEALEIVNFAINFYDYTIREKGAKILAKMEKPPSELLQKAKSDQNFYVKNLVYGKIDYGE